MHYFVDFKELKIKKEYNPHIFATVIDLRDKSSLTEINAAFEKSIDDLLVSAKRDIPTLFILKIVPDNEADSEDLITYAHLIVPIILQKLETGKGYERERRLDAPEQLKALNAKYSTIKRACNYDMRVHCLNIQIEYGPFIYYFCDGKDIKELDHE